MGTTRSKREVKSWLASGLLVLAAVGLTTSSVLGQSSARGDGQANWMIRWSSVRLGSDSFAHATLECGSLLPLSRVSVVAIERCAVGGGSQAASGLVEPKRQQAAALQSASRLDHWPWASTARPYQAAGGGSWTGRAASLLSRPLTLAAAGPLTYTCPSGGTCWIGGGTGNWSSASNWSNGVPTSSTNALIDNNNANMQGVSNVTLDIGGAQTSNLTVDSDDSLSFNNGTNLTVNTGIANAGKMSINSTGNSTALYIGGSNVTLSGGGTLTMGNNGNNFILGSAGGNTLTNVNNTIQGAGNIGDGRMALVNQTSGVIDANQPTALVIQTSNGTTNTGTLEATNGATLVLTGASGGNFTNTGGTIRAVGSGSTVNLQSGVTITGGTLTTSSGGLIETPGGTGATLSGLTNLGTYTVVDSSTTTLAGTITNSGTMNVSSGGHTTEVRISGNVTLTGAGTLTLSNNPNNFILGASTGTEVLTNQQTIQGAGNIGDAFMTVTNQGTIDANVSNALIIQPGSGGVTNSATLEATGGATLVLYGGGGAFSNNGGTIETTGTNSVVALENGVTIAGGTLTTASGGVIETPGGTGATLSGLTNLGTYTVVDSSETTLAGTITNSGTMNVSSGGHTTELNISGNVTLAGSGTLTLSNNANNFILGASRGGTEVLTSNNTIQGAGNIGDGLMGLVNNGTIIASQSSNPLFVDVSSKGFTNHGTLSVSSGDLMHVEGGSFTNFSGSTLTGGTYNVSGTLEVDQLGSSGGEIVTNAANIILNGTGSSLVDAAGLDALTKLNANSTAGSGFTITGSRNFTTAGNFTNNGGLTVGSGSTFKVPTGFSLTNFAGTTLTGGAYAVTGTLQFPGANIVTNAATITLTGSTSQIINQNGTNGLANFAMNNAGASFTINSGRNFTTASNFTNNGTLTVGSSTSTFDVKGNLTNFNSTSDTLTGGTYNVTGTLQFNNANIKTNAASITLTGASSQVIDQSKNNGLANFATNASGGSFTVAGGRTFTTAGAFTNNGSLTTTGSGSQFTTGGSAKFTNTGTLTTTGGDSETATGSSGSFTDNGTLTVGSGSTFATGGSLTNFSGTTLTGGTYAITGTLKFPGANIVTNAANITLTGTSSQILNSTGGTNGLANFATNGSGGVFSLQGGRTFTTTGNFSNAGTFTIGSGSTFTVGGSGVFTQTGGKTTDDGTLTDSGGFSLQGGSLFGKGTITGKVTSSGTITPGDSSTATGILTDKGAYTQNSTGALDISIGGTTAGTKYDQFNPTTASLNGALTTTLISGFTPSVGQQFTIMNFSSKTGTFASCDGRTNGTCPINSSEHFNITYNSNSVVLTVKSGAAPLVGQFNSLRMAGLSFLSPSPGLRPPSLLGEGTKSPLKTALSFGESVAIRQLTDSRLKGHDPHALTRSLANYTSIKSLTNPGIDLGYGAIRAEGLATTGSVMRQKALNRIASFDPARSFSSGAAPHRFISAGASAAVPNRINPTGALLRNNSHDPRMMAPKSLEYHIDLLSMLGTGRRQALRGLLGEPGNPNAASVGYLTFSGSHW